jgi:hypothetical protein
MGMVVTSGRFEKHTERMISINSEEQARLKKSLGRTRTALPVRVCRIHSSSKYYYYA